MPFDHYCSTARASCRLPHFFQPSFFVFSANDHRQCIGSLSSASVYCRWSCHQHILPLLTLPAARLLEVLVLRIKFQVSSKIMLDLSHILPFMELALKQAKLALDRLEVPVGCVIVENGRVIASGCNRTSKTRNATRHAEMEAIDVLIEQWKKDGLDCSQVARRFSACDLYVTCEPCIMCAAALSILGFREVYYGCANDKFGGCGSILSLHEGVSPEFSSTSSEARTFKVTGGILSEEAIVLFRSFYEQGNPNAPKPHRPVRASQLQPGADSSVDH